MHSCQGKRSGHKFGKLTRKQAPVTSPKAIRSWPPKPSCTRARAAATLSCSVPSSMSFDFDAARLNSKPRASMAIAPRHTKRIMSHQGRVGGLARSLSGSEVLSFFPACATCNHVKASIIARRPALPGMTLASSPCDQQGDYHVGHRALSGVGGTHCANQHKETHPRSSVT